MSKRREQHKERIRKARRERNMVRAKRRVKEREIAKALERIKDLRVHRDREHNADKIDRLRATVKRYKEREEFLEAREGKLTAKVKQARKRFRRWRQRKRRKKYYASPNFRYDEFDCHDGTKVPKAAYPALRALCKDVLEPARAKFGPIHITSGYRHAAYNRSIGGATASVHIYDYPGRNGAAVAADHWGNSVSPSALANFEEDKADGLGRYSTFVHADNRTRMGWPKSRWSG